MLRVSFSLEAAVGSFFSAQSLAAFLEFFLREKTFWAEGARDGLLRIAIWAAYEMHLRGPGHAEMLQAMRASEGPVGLVVEVVLPEAVASPECFVATEALCTTTEREGRWIKCEIGNIDCLKVSPRELMLG